MARPSSRPEEGIRAHPPTVRVVPSLPRAARPVLCALLGIGLLAGCNDSDTELDAQPDTETGSGSDDDAVAAAEQALQDQGFSPEGAECMVDSMLSSGISPQDLQAIDAASPDQELMDAAADAGVECASEIAGDIPPGLVDLEDPVVREQFVRTFAESTGLSVEASDCVAQYLIDNDVDYDALIAAAGGAEPDPETAEQVNAAIESCA